MKIKSNVSVALLKGVYAGTFIDLAVDADGNMITILRGAAGNDVAVDGSGYLSTAIKGKHGAAYSDVGVDASGNLITIIRGAAGNDVAVDASGNITSVIRGSTGVINQDASGNLAAAMKGLEGANVRDIAVDASGQMISIMKGAAGNNVAVDANGYLTASMKGLEGANVRDIAVDASGNMISVMKGDYAGALKTWKVDSAGRGEMFISDPTDVWGNVNLMGLGEHALRTHAPPITFDRRGDILMWADFESSTPNYKAGNSGSATCARSTDVAKHGNFSLKAALNGGVGAWAKCEMITNNFHVGGFGFSGEFASDDTNYMFYIFMEYDDGTQWKYTAELSYRPSDGRVQILIPTVGMTTVGTVKSYQSKYNFSTIKLVADLGSEQYMRALVFGEEIDISAYATYKQATDVNKSFISYIYYDAPSSNTVVYTDNIIVTENEPV